MQYQVPQFIEVEDKIFGPLTLKQVIYLAGGGGACLAIYTLLPLYAAIPLSLPFAALALALAFYEVNGRPFIVAMEHAVGYFFGTKLYLWKQRAPAAPTDAAVAENSAEASAQQLGLTVPKLSDSKLKDLSWSLNIKDQQAAGLQRGAPEFQL